MNALLFLSGCENRAKLNLLFSLRMRIKPVFINSCFWCCSNTFLYYLYTQMGWGYLHAMRKYALTTLNIYNSMFLKIHINIFKLVIK